MKITVLNIKRFKKSKLYRQGSIYRIFIRRLLTDSYNIKTCTCITFTYVVKEGLADDDRQLISNSEYTVNTHNYNNLKLPLTMDCSEYGSLLATR